MTSGNSLLDIGKRHVVKVTKRQAQIIRLIAAGLRNKEIGAELCLSIDTIKGHVHRINNKFGTASRLEIAVRYARQSLTYWDGSEAKI